MPELVYANLDEAFGRSEADEEIQDLLQAVRDKDFIIYQELILILLLLWLTKTGFPNCLVSFYH
jgi:hypothetical protein